MAPPNILRVSAFALAGWLCVVGNVRAQGFVEGDVIVTFKAGTTAESAQTALKKRALPLTRHFRLLSEKRHHQTMLVSQRKKTTAQLIAELKADPTVLTVEPDYLRRISATPNDPRLPEMWALNNTGQTINGRPGTAGSDIRFLAGREFARTPLSEIVVGVIDTGVDTTHADLAANIWHNPQEIPGNGVDDDGNGFVDDVTGYDFASGDADPADSGAHGTHVAGTIGAVGDNQTGVIGVNERARLLPLKVSTDGNTITSSAAMSALEYATALKNRGVNIVALNASYGGGGFSSAENAAIQAAGDAGILLCVAAGNSSANNDTTPTYPASYRLPNIIVVAATDQNDALASYSNFGSSTVDIAAPGSNILSTQPSTIALQTAGIIYSISPMTFAGTTSGLSGNLIDCGTGNTAAEFPQSVRGHIALILRGTETFATKVTNAMNAGATAALVYNNVSGAFVGTLQTSGGWIPAYTLSQADGRTIKSSLPKVGTLGFFGAPNYQFLDGTSMATPHIAGAVSIAAQNFPRDTMGQRRARVLSAVDQKSGLNGKVVTGGRLNLLRLLDGNADGIADWKPQIVPTTLPLEIVHESYSQNLSVTGGSNSYGWTLIGGTLPAGLHLGANGLLSGTSNSIGSFDFTVQVTDSTGAMDSRTFHLNSAENGPLDHFSWDYVPSEAYAGIPFAVKISARDSGQRPVSTANGFVNLTAVSATVSPTSVSLVGGIFIGPITSIVGNVVLRAEQGSYIGDSTAILVRDSHSSANDGLPDSWKNRFGLDTIQNISAADPDGDGLTNLQEFRAGTNPVSPSSTFKAVLSATNGTNTLTLQFPAVGGKLYRVSSTTDFSSWTPVFSNILPNVSGPQSVELPPSLPNNTFFRVELVP